MKDLSKHFGIVSVLFLILMAISPVKEHYREWRSIQHKYNDYILTLPQRISPVKEGIQQIWIPELDVIDRCSTCHLGISNSALKNAPQPYTAHPPMYHKPDRFGCTPCHRGQGLATSVKASTGFVKFWEEPIISSPLLESSCNTCHNEKHIPQAPLLNEGKELIEKYSCTGCHEIKGFEKSFTPTLEGIGSKVSREWLTRWLTDPKQVSAGTRMPNYMLSENEVQLFLDFLMSFESFPGENELDPLPESLKDEISETMYEEGETLFRTSRCISCHLVEGKGGKIAVEISTISSKASRQWIYNFIKNPKKLQPDITMPQFNFSETELQAVVAFIIEEYIDWDAPEETEIQIHVPDPNYYEKGLALFKKYNCGGCHILSAIAEAGEFGPSLSDMRNKPFYQLEFGQKDIPKTKEHYIIGKIIAPHDFLDNAVMPLYNFDEKQVVAITTAVLGMQESPVHELFRVEEDKQPSILFQGEFGKIVEKYQCLTCHKMFDQGIDIAPDLTRSGSQLKKEWIRNYFKLPYSHRPIMTERMPNFFMEESEIEILTDFLYMVMRDDLIDNTAEIEFSPTAVENGKRLYYNVYGCNSCHQINDQGGYVGPPFDNLLERLTPGWVFQKIKDPQKFDPEIPEPNYNMSDDDARAITAFLFSGKRN